MIVIACPGQGSQTPGFLTEWLDLPGARDFLEAASDASGVDLIRHGTTSDADTIRATEIAQPLIVAASILSGSTLHERIDISNAGVDYQLNDTWRFGLSARAQGDYYIDELNEQGKYGGFAVLDANVRYQVSATTSVDLQMKNLTDRDYEYVWFDNFFWAAGDEQPMFSPAPGRSAYLSVNMKL